jgi:hypothetical protein
MGGKSLAEDGGDSGAVTADSVMVFRLMVSTEVDKGVGVLVVWFA